MAASPVGSPQTNGSEPSAEEQLSLWNSIWPPHAGWFWLLPAVGAIAFDRIFDRFPTPEWVEWSTLGFSLVAVASWRWSQRSRSRAATFWIALAIWLVIAGVITVHERQQAAIRTEAEKAAAERAARPKLSAVHTFELVYGPSDPAKESFQLDGVATLVMVPPYDRTQVGLGIQAMPTITTEKPGETRQLVGTFDSYTFTSFRNVYVFKVKDRPFRVELKNIYEHTRTPESPYRIQYLFSISEQ
jgi:hypothetical protein